MKAGKIALVTAGSLAALLAAGLLAGAVWALNADTDSAGYVVTGEHRAQTVTHAFASDGLDVDSDFDWILDRGPKLRVDAPDLAGRAAWLDLGKVAQSARIKLNGRDYGVVLMPPFRVKVENLQHAAFVPRP